MEGLRWRIVLVAVALMSLAAAADHITVVGGNKAGWMPNVNYKSWAQSKHFYKGDWLFFVYRKDMNVLEVTKKDYKNCVSKHPLHKWSRGYGRDVVPLNQTRMYYFISGKGYCFKGMKLAIKVETRPPPK